MNSWKCLLLHAAHCLPHQVHPVLRDPGRPVRCQGADQAREVLDPGHPPWDQPQAGDQTPKTILRRPHWARKRQHANGGDGAWFLMVDRLERRSSGLLLRTPLLLKPQQHRVNQRWNKDQKLCVATSKRVQVPGQWGRRNHFCPFSVLVLRLTWGCGISASRSDISE